MTDTSKEVERFGDWIAANADPHVVDLWNAAYDALATKLAEVEAERDAYKEGDANFWTVLDRAETAEAALLTARRDALEEAIDGVHFECWTDGDGGPATEVLLAEQDTTARAVNAIRALIDNTEGTRVSALKLATPGMNTLSPASLNHKPNPQPRKILL